LAANVCGKGSFKGCTAVTTEFIVGLCISTALGTQSQTNHQIEFILIVPFPGKKKKGFLSTGEGADLAVSSDIFCNQAQKKGLLF